MSRVAVIAGQGGLATAVVQALDAPLVYALEGFAPEFPATSFRIERLVPFLDNLLDQNVTQVVFAGAIRRPRLDPEAFDPRTAQMVPRILRALQMGDDAALREVISVFEEHGLTVRSVEDVVTGLIPGQGVLSGTVSREDEADAARAADILVGLGPFDIGQGVVVARGLCLAIETLPGTEAMLQFARDYRSLHPNPNGASGVFYKAPKPGQDRRVDLPTLGPDTVSQAAAAGLSGICWQAGGVILLDQQAAIRQAEAEGLFLWAR